MSTPSIGEWVRLKADRSEFSAEQPEHQPRLHLVIDIDARGRVLTACHRSTYQVEDPYQVPDSIDGRPKCKNCVKKENQS